MDQGKYQASHASEELLPAEWVILVLFPRAGEHLTCIRTDMLKYHICSRKSLARWVGDIGRV